MIDDRPIGAALNRNLGSAVAPGEAVEAEIDQFNQRRDEQRRQTEGEREEEEAWSESVRLYNARRREENRREWCGYFERLATYLRARAEEYDHRAQILMEDQSKGA